MNLYVLLAIAVMAAATFFLRAIPFLAFRDRETPPYIRYLGTWLPYAAMALLVVYCLKGIDFASAAHGVPEIIATVLVVGLHLWKKNTVLSIIAGTACYMILIRLM